MPRIPLFNPATMTSEQAAVYNAIVTGPRGQLVGPLRAALHRPELADRWQKFGEVLRYGTSISKKLVELAIIVTARRWNSQVEWHIHSIEASRAGLPDAAIEAIRIGAAPVLADELESDVYEFARQVQMHGNVDDALYSRLHARLGTVGIVELGAVIGYYTLVSMTLNLHAIPLPAGVAREPLDAADTLSALPALPAMAPGQ
jgi:4-carboxymuconolactone decarboxylase